MHEIDFEKIITRNVTDYYEACPSTDPLDRMEYFYIKKFLKYRLDANDRCAMAFSIEARVPFCDERVIEVSLSIPPALNLKDGTEKAVLREAFRDILPKEIAERRKYALPESKDVALYRMILAAFDQQILQADESLWTILNQEHALELRNLAEQKIIQLEHGEISDQVLTAEIPLTEPVEFRIKHLFLLLTCMRWHRLYFVEKVFS